MSQKLGYQSNYAISLETITLPTDEHLDKVATKIISGLEKVEERLREKDIRFLHVDINDVTELDVTSVPSLVYFKNGEPVPYEGKIFQDMELQ